MSYASSIVAVVVIAIGLLIFFFFYEAPTCSDGVKNGSELGVDCGGACVKLCQDAFLPPTISWTRMREIAPHLYNIAAYVVNPNAGVGAARVPYRIGLFDATGKPLADIHDTMIIPPGRNTMVFAGSVSSGTTTPLRAFFEFTGVPSWSLKSDPAGVLAIDNKEYNEGPMGSSLLVTVSNNGARPVRNVEVNAILKDKDGTVIDFSKTVIDEVSGLGTAVAPFTWPWSHDGTAVTIEVLPVAE
ncbi:MAG: hypothetical protein WCV82_03200 [Candidatus Paceibacterota bacterium]